MKMEEFWTTLGIANPYDWQRRLTCRSKMESALIRIPTGFGKTLGVLSAWLWNRVVRNDDSWPRRLVWCLPMRTLVEQTESEARQVLKNLGILWNEQESHKGKVGVHLLMGGSDSGDWHLYPEECAVLIGTQDMLLSRALNRGYGAARARWPMDFGLLNQDSLWVMDEIQLMDVGLATSAQLQAFRQSDAQKPGGYGNLRSCHTWWMSATLQGSWLKTVDTDALLQALPPMLEIPAAQRLGGLWNVHKTLRVEPVENCAELVWKQHTESKGLTLVVLNTVDSAIQLYGQLQKQRKGTAVDLRLVHSRFRPAERMRWREEFLRKDASLPSEGRIIVATQVVEAGVDISARTLITDLAPWPSLVQRFGRCARYVGESGDVFVLDRDWSEKDEKKALPYEIAQLLEAKLNLEKLGRASADVSPQSLETYEDAMRPEERSRLYPYKPKHLLLQREWLELFDTSPDLSGADLDISRFIRSGEENDCLVFWREIPETGPDDDWKPLREELCAIPFLKAREWLGVPKPSQQIKSITRKGTTTPVAWVWDWVDACWKRRTEQRDLLPGTIVLVEASFGGYSLESGWNMQQKAEPSLSLDLHLAEKSMLQDKNLQDKADSGEQREDLSVQSWRSLVCHLQDVEQETRNIADVLWPTKLPEKPWLSLRRKLVLAGFTHDIGKASAYFQGSIDINFQNPSIPKDLRDELLAKAPKGAWPKNRLYRKNGDGEQRKGFRHELASALALFDLLRQIQPSHPGLLGECRDYFPEQKLQVEQSAEGLLSIQESHLSKLFDPSEYPERWCFDLVAYLVASHHGKVRCSLQASPLDQEYRAQDGRGMPIRGVREGDELPAVKDKNGNFLIPTTKQTLEPAKLGLSPVTGPSWTERVQGLLDRFGPSALAYLEAILRAADIRASRNVDSACKGV
jgi:CRISPR-associated endonuclease/helicase Cas3